MKKIGIPRALIYYKFSKLWIPFFENLGTEVLISSATTKAIKIDAVSYAPNEDCYSTKLYYGHALALKDKVDFLFIPRFGGSDKRNVGCPKFIGLAEVLTSMFPDLPPIIMPHYNRAKGRDTKISFFTKAYKVGLKFTKNPIKIIKAFNKAVKSYKEYKKHLIIDEETLHKWERSEISLNNLQDFRNSERILRVALVAHSYVLNDPFISLNILTMLNKLGVDVILSEQMPRELIENQLKKQNFQIYFDYEREILGTIMHFLESKTIDGIIHIMVFSCGPDSIAGEMASRYSKRDPHVPLLQLVFDELTAETGLKTRVEAFIDMLRMSSENRIKYSNGEIAEPLETK
ncbi:MAG TPA: acyl-CoA dehydratase activase-related protein [Candidatus Bathyarchaeia archaeon]|nr:acyl-CoA dehydratase activase-related protein [Candidatus Bathyarchaeia archaeon]